MSGSEVMAARYENSESRQNIFKRLKILKVPKFYLID